MPKQLVDLGGFGAAAHPGQELLRQVEGVVLTDGRFLIVVTAAARRIAYT